MALEVSRPVHSTNSPHPVTRLVFTHGQENGGSLFGVVFCHIALPIEATDDLGPIS